MPIHNIYSVTASYRLLSSLALSSDLAWHLLCSSVLNPVEVRRTTCTRKWECVTLALNCLTSATFIPGQFSLVCQKPDLALLAHAVQLHTSSVASLKWVGWWEASTRGLCEGWENLIQIHPCWSCFHGSSLLFGVFQLLFHLFIKWLICLLEKLRVFLSCLGLISLILTSWRNQMHTTICRMLLTWQSNTLVLLSFWTQRVRIPSVTTWTGFLWKNVISSVTPVHAPGFCFFYAAAF